MMQRVLIPTDSHDPNSLKIALAHSIRIAEATGLPAKVTLLVHTLAQVEAGALPSSLGRAEAKALKSKKQLSLPGGGSVTLATLKTLPSRIEKGVIVAYNAETNLLAAADDVDGLIGIVAVPDQEGICDPWAHQWGAMVHGQEPTERASPIEDPVIENALTELIRMVNPSTGVSHPRDKEYASATLRILRAKGHTLDSNAIRTWALQRGWKSRDADELAKLAAKIAALRSKPSLSGLHDPDGRYSRWQQ